MTKKITDDLTLVERSLRGSSSFFSKYIPSYFISNQLFEAAVKRLGGYVYNVSVGKVGNISFFNGFTWMSVSDGNSFDDHDMWAERLEQAIFEEVGLCSPVYVHHPDKAGLHTWGIEFNRNRLWWDRPADAFVAEARKLVEDGSGWFYQSGSDSPDKGYQFFEYMGTPKHGFGSPEMVARAAATKIAEALGTIAFIKKTK